jgi:hypothetical protein
MQLDRCFVSESSECFAAITLCVASQRVFIVVSVYFVIDSVRKLLDRLSYMYEVGHIGLGSFFKVCSSYEKIGTQLVFIEINPDCTM